MAGSPPPSGSSKEFARRFLSENRGRVAYLAFIQVAVIRYAAQDRWVWCALGVLVLAWSVWLLVRRAAGIQDPPAIPRSRDEMTPREAFWLDPSAVFDRNRRHTRAG